MARNLFLAILLVSLSFVTDFACFAEKIFYKDGKTADEIIVKRDSNSLWAKHAAGIVAISIKNIARVQNDDGSVSKYDYENICDTLEKAIKEKKYKDAIKLCDLLLETFSKSPQVHYLRGLLYQKTGDYAKSKEDYNFVVQNQMADEKVFNNLGVIYARDRDYKSAVDLFMKAVEKNPQLPEAHENLAYSLVQTNDYTKARDEFNRVLQLEPNNYDAKSALEELGNKK